MARALTLGEEEFRQASDLVTIGETDKAIEAFRRLSRQYPATWIDRVSRERLARLDLSRSDAGDADSAREPEPTVDAQPEQK